MDTTQYRRFIDEIAAVAGDHDQIIGLVALGSTADESRSPDEWSDHDVWVITKDGAATEVRDDPNWLPDADRIVGHFVETVHGRSIVYADGHLVELAVFEDHELEIARANDFRVLYDAGGIEDRVAAIAQRTRADTADAGADGFAAGRFVTQLIIGLGRYGRGELLSANQLIQELAVASLLQAIAAADDSPSASVLDNLDPHRRFEHVHPAAAARIVAALRQPLIDVAVSLIDIGEQLLMGRIDALTPDVFEALRNAAARARAERPPE